MRKVFKITVVLITVLLGHAALLLGVLHLLPDEELLPGAQAWLEREPPDFPAEQNADYYLWGLIAPVDYPVFEFGRARIERFASLYAESAQPPWDELGDSALLPDGVAPESLLSVPALSSLCNLLFEPCLERLRDEAPALLAEGDNALLRARYQRLLEVPHNHTVEEMRPNEQVNRYGPVLTANFLHHAHIVQQFLSGEPDEALAALAADLRFSRMLLAESDYLFGEMMFAALVTRDLLLYSELLDSGVAIDRVVKAVRAIEPLTAAEYDVTEVMRGEFRFAVHLSNVLVLVEGGELTDDGKLMELGLEQWQLSLYPLLPERPNALANRVYRDRSLWAELATLSPTQIDARYRQLLDSDAWQPAWWEFFYHRDVVAFAEPDKKFPAYLYRLHDLDGLIRMLQLKAEIRSKRISAGEVKGFLANHRSASVYGQPIRWCPSRQILYYQPLPKEGQHMEWLYELPLQLLSEGAGEQAI